MTESTLPTDLPDDVVERAFRCAAHIHRNDKRKGHDFPYLSHLMAVAAIVWEHGGTPNQVAAALLHDAAEDHGGPAMISTLSTEFDDEVVTIVSQCSDALPKAGEEKPPWLARKRAYLEAIPTKPQTTLLVSAADKLHNARAILADYRQRREELWATFNKGRPYQLWYYRELARSLAAALPGPLTDDLQRVVGEINLLVADNDPGYWLEVAEAYEEAAGPSAGAQVDPPRRS